MSAVGYMGRHTPYRVSKKTLNRLRSSTLPTSKALSMNLKARPTKRAVAHTPTIINSKPHTLVPLKSIKNTPKYSVLPPFPYSLPHP